ncbi:MAG: GNAT family N-acetyltransferase [Clostridia bacterium]|nr:GNAT family N-acetyltransferase [Clostridia bacterium]MBR7033670.1 GNAT family N-acetyltransferase [Clostridia bacterium]
MLVREFEFKMKDGRTASVRSPREDDAAGLLDYLYVTACETEFLMRYPEECGKYTIEGELRFIKNANSSDREAAALCLVEGEIVGLANVSWSGAIKTKHRASVAIALIREFWDQGIGTVLMEELIRIAEENEDLIQIELDFIEGNVRARALYEKLGFRIVGVKPNAIRLKDGTLLNEYSMIKEIKR